MNSESQVTPAQSVQITRAANGYVVDIDRGDRAVMFVALGLSDALKMTKDAFEPPTAPPPVAD